MSLRDRSLARRGPFSANCQARPDVNLIDELGRTSVWVRTYRPDRPGSGFVQMWGLGATADRLPLVRAVAEYGLLRVAGSG